jgi:hypothetical protein
VGEITREDLMCTKLTEEQKAQLTLDIKACGEPPEYSGSTAVENTRYMKLSTERSRF